MFESIDRYLIDEVFQKLADRFEQLTGRSCFLLARVCVSLPVLYTLVKLTYAILLWDWDDWFWSLPWIVVPILPPWVVGLYWGIEMEWEPEEYTEKRPGGMCVRAMNPIRHNGRYMRGLLLGIGGLQWAVFLSNTILVSYDVRQLMVSLVLVSLVLAVYFSACAMKFPGPTQESYVSS